MTKYYIDCEFDGHNGPLLSMAVVRDDGRSIYIRTIDAVPADPWVVANVMPLMDSHDADQDVSTFTDNVGSVLRRFVIGEPTIIADSPVDIARFCQAISTDPYGGWASTDYLRMTFEVHNVDCYPTDLPGAVQHNAWWDAMALRHKLIPARDGIEAQRGLNDVFLGDMVPAEGISPDAYDRAPKHYYWMAGEPECPSDIKAANGELHTLRCKICELDNPRNPICHADAMFERFARPAT